MKNKIFYFAKWSISTKQLNDIRHVKVTTISTLFQKLKVLVGGSISLGFIKCTMTIANSVKFIAKAQGIKGLTLYLKASAVLLQQSVAGHRIIDVGALGPRVSRTKGVGLPRLIPARHRLIIVNRRPGYTYLIKFYLSIFYIYRVLEFPGKLKLETITAPGKFFNMPLYEGYMENFLNLFLKRKGNTFPIIKPKIFPIFRSSPFTSRLFQQPIKVGKKFKL